MKSEKELKELAKDVYEGKVFLANDQEALQCAFSLLMIFGDLPKDTVALYEDISKSGPRSINGYPFFTSCRMLNKDEWKIFVLYYNQYKELVKNWV